MDNLILIIAGILSGWYIFLTSIENVYQLLR
ncbi:MAG: hypothetical protein PWR10_2364 [Halanaerobiales bacterium]|nr:hypothetical protein [Halanaerobiales bacterium]